MTPIKRSAFSHEGKWFKGNIHSHTTVSDGTVDPAQQAADYKAQGYDFLALTDHNVMLTHAQLSSEDFLMLPGWERDIPITERVKCIHVVGLFPADTPDDAKVSRPKGNPDEMSMQDLLDQMRGENAFTVIAHPLWSRMEPEEVRSLTNYDAIEVFNTGTECLCHAGRADVYWDMLLRDGKRVLAIACDDTHGKDKKPDRFGGFVMVNARALTKEAILDALKRGNYYSSCGPEIHEFTVEDGKVHVKCSPCEEIHEVTYPPRGKAHFALGGEMLTELTYTLKGGESYVRVECVDSKGKPAWSNAIFMD